MLRAVTLSLSLSRLLHFSLSRCNLLLVPLSLQMEAREHMQLWETDRNTLMFIEQSLERSNDLTKKMVRKQRI